MRTAAIAALLFIILGCTAADAQEITVLLRSGAQSVSAAGQQLTLSDPGGRPYETNASSVTLQWANGAAVDNSAKSYQLPLSISAYDKITCDGKSYKGSLVLEAGAAGFSVVNKVDVEDYLMGVLKTEMSPKWPAEALKAQAVLARTYAVQAQKHGRYNVCAAPHCQTYSGCDNSPSIAQAVSATDSEILVYSGRPAQVFYFGDSGGATASAKSVWGKDIPYLVSRSEPIGYNSPAAKWTAVVSLSQAESRLAAAGISVGDIKSARVSARDESGRAQQIEITGSAGRRTIAASKFRAAIGYSVIKSTLFDFSAEPAYAAAAQQAAQDTAFQPQPSQETEKTYPKPDVSTMPDKPEDKLFWMAKNKIFSTAELVSMIGKEKEYPNFIAEGEARMNGKKMAGKASSQKNTFPNVGSSAAKPVQIPVTSSNSAASVDGGTLTVYGRGSGHGVGMPQWGAKALAEAGWTYVQILEYYFPGTTIERGIQ